MSSYTPRQPIQERLSIDTTNAAHLHSMCLQHHPGTPTGGADTLTEDTSQQVTLPSQQTAGLMDVAITTPQGDNIQPHAEAVSYMSLGAGFRPVHRDALGRSPEYLAPYDDVTRSPRPHLYPDSPVQDGSYGDYAGSRSKSITLHRCIHHIFTWTPRSFPLRNARLSSPVLAIME